MDPIFVSLLQRQREALNELFFQARHYAHQLPSETVYRFLEETLQAVVLAAAPHLKRDELDQLALKLTVLALDLIGKQLLGPEGPFALIESAWRRLFCAHPHLLAASPRRAIAAISNALIQLCLHPAARPDQWLNQLEALGGDCPNLDALLKLGQVLGWQAGLAHYRAGALALIPTLPTQLQADLLQGHPLSAWLASPWCGSALAGIEIVHSTGSFVGWGGKLHEPPRLAWEGDTLLVADSQACWYVFANTFGESWFRRTETALSEASDPGPWNLNADGQVGYGDMMGAFPELAGFGQAVGNAHTLAIAMPDSFTIRLLSLPGSANP